MTSPDSDCEFFFEECQFWLFPKVAFLCVGLKLHKISQLDCIVNPGHADSISRYYKTEKDEFIAFSFEKAILTTLYSIGATPFYFNEGALFSEIFVFSLAVVDKDFHRMETIHDLSFCLQKMAPLTKPISDPSLSDVKFVYSAKDPETDSYRWGCCTSLQSVAFVQYRKDKSFRNILQMQYVDSMPIILLVLYQKYTCLSFTERITELRGDNGKKLQKLRQDMLEFKAYGTVPNASISRWMNIQDIYTQLLDTNGIPEAIKSIDDKLEVLSERRNERRNVLENFIGVVISLFGILSLAEPMQIIKSELIEGGSRFNAIYYCSTVFLPAVVVTLIFILIRIKWK